MQFEHMSDDAAAGGGIEIAGRLIGKQDLRFAAERARQRDALLFATGQLLRIVIEPRGKTDALERGACASTGTVKTGEFGRQHHVLQRRETGEQRSEEHTSELQSLMRISYAVFCLKQKKHIR